jgi:acyl-coenzyme A thioesterase PaaI-like protein
MAESLRTRLTRIAITHFFPAFRGTGGKITYIADDWREVRVDVPLSRRTRNYVGTIFGGSMYGAVDPIYMVMLIKLLGPGYTVWDKSASIRFRRPGRSTLHARFVIDDAELDAIRETLKTERAIDRAYRIDLVDDEGTVHAEVEKILHIRPKRRAGSANPAAPPG